MFQIAFKEKVFIGAVMPKSVPPKVGLAGPILAENFAIIGPAGPILAAKTGLPLPIMVPL